MLNGDQCLLNILSWFKVPRNRYWKMPRQAAPQVYSLLRNCSVYWFSHLANSSWSTSCCRSWERAAIRFLSSHRWSVFLT